MMYTTTVGVEMLHRMADIIDTVDGMVLEVSERKVDMDGRVVQLHHQLRNAETRMLVVVEWKEDITVHMWEMGEQCREDCRRMREMEEQVNQLQALLVAQSWEMEMMSNVIRVQNEVFQVQSELFLEVERKQSWERRMDPVGRTIGNPILIEDDVDEVTLVDALGVVRELTPINDTDDSSD